MASEPITINEDTLNAAQEAYDLALKTHPLNTEHYRGRPDIVAKMRRESMYEALLAAFTLDARQRAQGKQGESTP